MSKKAKNDITTPKGKRADFHAKHTIPSEFPGCDKGLKYTGDSSSPTEQAVKQLFAKPIREKRKEVMVDFKGKPVKLESDASLQYIPNIVKALDLSCNSFVQVETLGELNKLKYLSVAKSNLSKISLAGLDSLIGLDLSQNRLAQLPNFEDCVQLQNLNISSNPISAGFRLLGGLKALRVLDMSNCKLTLTAPELKASILDNIRGHVSLQYLSFLANPICQSIPDLKLFVINELPQLKYYDWVAITKEERVFAKQAATSGKWASGASNKAVSRAVAVPNRRSINLGYAGTPTNEKHKEQAEAKAREEAELKALLESDETPTVGLTGQDELGFDIKALLNEDVDSMSPQAPISLSLPTQPELDINNLLGDVLSALSEPTAAKPWSPAEIPEWWTDMTDVKILKGLGQGTYGGSFLVSWAKFTQPVVAKKLNEKNASDPDSLERFVEEVKQFTNFHHPNLVRVLGCGFDTVKYVFTEAVPNSLNLYQVIKRTPLSPDHALHIVRCGASALNYLHSNGVIHGAIKSKNFLVDLVTQKVTITDFGFMDMKDEVSAEDCALEYVAYEILSGQTYDEKIDVYALGLVFLALITRSEPYEGLRQPDIIQNVTQGIAPRLPRWPPMAVDIVRQCISMDPAARPSAHSLAEMLDLPVNVLWPPEASLLPEQKVNIQDEAKELELMDIEIEEPEAIGIGIPDEEAEKLEALWDKLEDLLGSIPAKQQQGLKALLQVLNTPQRIAYAASNKNFTRAIVAITDRTGALGQYEVVSEAFETIRELGQYLEWGEQFGHNKQMFTMMFSVFEKTQDVGLCNRALSAMTVLINTFQPNAKATLEAGAWRVLIPLIPAKITLQQIELVRLISVIVEDKTMRTEFVKKKGFPELLSLLETTNPELKMCVLEALCSFNFDTKTKDQLKALDLENKALRMAKSQNPALKGTGLRSLYKLTKGAKKMKKSSIHEYANIFHASIEGIDIENMSVEERQAVVLVGRFHLALATHSFQDQITYPGIFEKIVDWSASEHVDVAWVFFQLIYIFIKERCFLEAYLLSYNGLPTLFAALRDCDPKIRSCAFQCLTLINAAGFLKISQDDDWGDLFSPVTSVLYFSGEKQEILLATLFIHMVLQQQPPEIIYPMVKNGILGGLLQVIADTELPEQKKRRRHRRNKKKEASVPKGKEEAGSAAETAASPRKDGSSRSHVSRSKSAKDSGPPPEFIQASRTAQSSIGLALACIAQLTQTSAGQTGVLQDPDSLEVITKHLTTQFHFSEPEDVCIPEKNHCYLGKPRSTPTWKQSYLRTVPSTPYEPLGIP